MPRSGEPARLHPRSPAARRNLELTVTLADGLLSGRFPGKDEVRRRSHRGQPPSRVRPGRPDLPRTSAHPTRWSRATPRIWVSSPTRLFPQRGPGGRAGRRGPGLRPPAGDPPPRHQAVEPPARYPGHRLGHRLRPGQGGRHRRADRPGRLRRDAAVHGPGAVSGPGRPAQRRLQPGPDPLRDGDAAAGLRGRRAGAADRADAARRAAPAAPARSRIPRDLETIVLKAIAKEPGRRYQTAGELAEDLQRFLADRPIKARRSTATEQFGRWCRRNPWLAAANIAAAVLTTILAIGSTLAAWTFRDQRDQIGRHLGHIQEAETKGRERLFESLTAQASARRHSRQVGQRFDSLDALAQAVKIARDLNLGEERLLELRNAAIACLALPDLRIAKEWNGWPTGSFSVDFDSTLERYARVDRQGVVHIHRVADDAEICRLPGMGPGEAWAWFSPDGQFLALQRLDSRFKVWKLAGPEPVVVVEDVSAPGGAAFSPDSRRLAIGHADGSIRLYELPSGRQLKQLEGVPRARWMAFHPDGPTVGR